MPKVEKETTKVEKEMPKVEKETPKVEEETCDSKGRLIKRVSRKRSKQG